jgi:hypothetical protein
MAGPAALAQSVRAISRGGALAVAITRLVASPTGCRIVLVTIDTKHLLLDQIMWLRHELQHAREIADAGEVRTRRHCDG